MDDLPKGILEEAAIWHSRRIDSAREGNTEKNQALQNRLDAWLLVDVRHAQAFKEIERLDRALEVTVSQADENDLNKAPSLYANVVTGTVWPAKRRKAPTERIAAIAACLLAFVTVGLYAQGDIATRLRADHLTAVGEETAVMLEDDSQVIINTDSALAVNFTDDLRQVRLLKGEAWFDVSHDDQRPFIVATREGEVRVTGTKFNVWLDGDETVVSLDEGRVELTSSDRLNAQPVVLSPGKQASLSEEGVSQVSEFDPVAVNAWRRGQFVFYNTPLSEVVATLNRHRSGRIVILDDDLENLQVSGIFQTDHPDEALEIINSTLPVSVVKFTDYLVFLAG